MTPWGTDEQRRAAELLELPQLLEDVARHASLARARDAVRCLVPDADHASLEQSWEWFDELSAAIERGLSLPLGDFIDLEDALGDDRSRQGLLTTEDLSAIGSATLTIAGVLETCQNNSHQIPCTAARVKDCDNPRSLGEHFRSCLEPDGRIRDDASPRLAQLRRAAVAAQARIRDAANESMRALSGKGWVTSGELVLRGERFCVPVKSGRRRQVSGIIHDRSDTGNTLFIEPAAVVEAANELQELKLSQVEEERRITADLNRMLADRAEGLRLSFLRLVEIDSMLARVLWGRRAHALRPRLHREPCQDLELIAFRHPLLEQSLREAGRGEDLVPLTLTLERQRVLLISGPNAGGKTVALKAVGLSVLMAQCVIPLATEAEARLPMFDRVLMDAGDDQSIADALSSFSAHLTHVRNILNDATERSLVLLDEVGSGTDPAEGVALARAILETLAMRAGVCLCTTHYGELKALVHEVEGFRNASMAYDHEKLQPRFEFRLDVPGQSHAMEIAARLGLPGDTLKRSSELVGADRMKLETILRELEVSRDRARDTLQAAEREVAEAKARQHEYETRARDMKRDRKKLLDEAKREAQSIVRNARGKIERLLADIRAAGGDEAAREAARDARQTVDSMEDSYVVAQPKTPARPISLEPGSSVRHVALGSGRVIQVRGDQVTLDIRGRRVVARVDQLEGAADVEPSPAREGSVRVEVEEVASGAVTRIDVRGQDRDDAWRMVDKAIDRCGLSGMTVLEIVHGKGTGRLRSSLAARLSRDRRVRAAHVGGQGRYDDGVTVVEL